MLRLSGCDRVHDLRETVVVFGSLNQGLNEIPHRRRIRNRLRQL